LNFDPYFPDQEYETIRSTYEKKAEQLEAEPVTSREVPVAAGVLSANAAAFEVAPNKLP
jgi:hypothetical protein